MSNFQQIGELLISSGLVKSLVFSFLSKFLLNIPSDRIKALAETKRVKWRIVISVFIVSIICFEDLLYTMPVVTVLILIIVSHVLLSTCAILPYEQIIVFTQTDKDKIKRLLERKHSNLTCQCRIALCKRYVELLDEREKRAGKIYASKKMENMPLYPCEIKKHLLPSFEVYMDIGAVKELGIRLDRWHEYNNDFNYLSLQLWYMMQKCEYMQMYKIVEKMDKITINDRYRLMNYSNMVHISNTIYDKDKYETYIRKEMELFDQGLYSSYTCENLLYYYDNHNMTAEAEKLADFIMELSFNNFDVMSNYYTIVYEHYKKLEDMEACVDIVNLLKEKSHEMLTTEEAKIIYELQLCRIAFEINHHWQEESIKYLKERKYYLNYSYNVAMMFIKTMSVIMKDANYVRNLGLNEKAYIDFDDSVAQSEEKWKIYRTRLLGETLPYDCLYERCHLHMDEYEVTYELARIEDSADMNLRKRIAILEQVIKECKNNDNKAERLYFINILIDEIVTCLNQIQSPETQLCFPKVYRDYKDNEAYYINIRDKYLKEMVAEVENAEYDLSLNFYVFHLAECYMLSGDRDKAVYYFNKYNGYGIDIHYLTLTYQKKYRTMKEKISSWHK